MLSGGAAARVAKSELSELVVTDSISTGEPDPAGSKIRRLTIAPLLAEAIKRISDEASVSSLFDYDPIRVQPLPNREEPRRDPTPVR